MTDEPSLTREQRVMRYIVRVMKATRRIALVWAAIFIAASLLGYADWSWWTMIKLTAVWLFATAVIALIIVIWLDTFQPEWRKDNA